MMFQLKNKKYFAWVAFVVFATFFVFVHHGYADKSDLTEAQSAYDEPLDITGSATPDMLETLPVEDVHPNMFDDSGSENTKVETLGKGDAGNSTKSIKQRWQEGRKFREADDEYHVKNFENDLVIRTQDGKDHYFSIELAIHPEEQARGLMFRKSMPQMHGMLFVFNSSVQRSFWMKNTLIPLDIIFLAENGRINHIHHNAKPLDESMISSLGPAFAVLEINGGMSHELGLNVGDTILHTAFKNRHTE